jgi:hypothetical protein
VAVLAFRGFTFWLPIAPGIAAYFALRRVVGSWGTTPDAPPAPSPVPLPARRPCPPQLVAA